MRRDKKFVCVGVGVLASYVGSFYVLMVPNLPSYDADGRPVFGNCPRFSESVRVPGPFSIYSGRASFLNYFYYPFEWVHTRGRPRTSPT